MGDFFAFRRLVTTDLVRVAYPLGASCILTAVIVVVALARDLPQTADLPTLFVVLAGLLAVLVLEVAWRVACETAAVAFLIHERLSEQPERAEWSRAS